MIKFVLVVSVALSKLMLLLIMCMLTNSIFANGLVFGTIKYQDGTPAVDVVLNINNTSIVAVSDEQGKYQLENVPLGQHAIIIKPFGENLKVVHLRVDKQRMHFPIE